MKYAALPLALALFTGCPEPITDPHEWDPPLIAGFDAASPALDAVGSLAILDPEYGPLVFCTGTLIGPKTVLTAAHCGGWSEAVFLIGPDAKAPRGVARTLAFEAAPISTGGAMGVGSDVGVYHLAAPVEGVLPFPAAAAPLQPEDIGQKLVSIGFGVQSNIDGVYGPPNNTRKAGTTTLHALEGKLFELMLGSLDAFLAYVTEQVGAIYVAEHYDDLVEYYETTVLLSGYEAFVGKAPGDSQTCFGDSGGPLLRRGALGAIEVVGVVSGGIGSAELICDKGGVYAIFGESTHAFLQDALTWEDPCDGLSVSGVCEGTVARRCTRPEEGPRRAVALDCAQLNQVCGVGSSGEVACLDPVP